MFKKQLMLPILFLGLASTATADNNSKNSRLNELMTRYSNWFSNQQTEFKNWWTNGGESKTTEKIASTTYHNPAAVAGAASTALLTPIAAFGKGLSKLGLGRFRATKLLKPWAALTALGYQAWRPAHEYLRENGIGHDKGVDIVASAATSQRVSTCLTQKFQTVDGQKTSRFRKNLTALWYGTDITPCRTKTSESLTSQKASMPEPQKVAKNSAE